MERQSKKTLSTTANKRITIQTVLNTADGEGGYSESLVDGSTVWASVSPIRATQQAEYKSIGVDATHIIMIRGNITINETDRIKFGTREFEVLTVENIQERGVIKVCTCKERR